MTTRISLFITWSYTIPAQTGQWIDFSVFGRYHLQRPFLPLSPYYTFRVLDTVLCKDSPDHNQQTARIIWDINLADLPGAWDTPDAFVAHLKNTLGAHPDTKSLDIQVFRVVDKNSDDVRDHAKVTDNVFPTFFAVYQHTLHTVFKQDTYWHWVMNDDQPAVGPIPDVLLSPWTDDTPNHLFSLYKASVLRRL